MIDDGGEHVAATRVVPHAGDGAQPIVHLVRVAALQVADRAYPQELQVARRGGADVRDATQLANDVDIGSGHLIIIADGRLLIKRSLGIPTGTTRPLARNGMLYPASVPTLRIWCNAGLETSARVLLEEGARDHRLVTASDATTNLAGGMRSEELWEADVAFGQPDPDQVVESPRLRWVHLTSAGYTRYDKEAFREGIERNGAVLTNSSSVYADPCAQHILAFMMAHARRLPEASADQAAGAGWTYARHRPLVRVLRGDRVLMLGYGAIARRLAELLAPYGVVLGAVRRRREPDDPNWVIEAGGMTEALAMADHVVNVLPASASTARFVNRAFLTRAKPGAVFYNVGRGTTVDQEALAEALTKGRLSAAYLDVADPEPLPSDHFLWRTPNCHLTPHVAGGHQDEDAHLVRHFLANLRRFELGEPLKDRVFGSVRA